MKKEIKLVRLSSGEEIIANIEEYENTYKLYDGIVMIPAGEGKIGFMPWMPYTKAAAGVTIDKKWILFVLDPIGDMVDQFKQATSPIDLSATKGIVK